MKDLLVSFLIALVAGSVLNGYMQSGSVEPSTLEGGELNTEALASMVDTSDGKFSRDVLESSKPVLVDFWAKWCAPCKVMHPVLQSLADEYADKLQVVRLDVDANPSTTEKYSVSEIPTFIIFKDGKKMARFTGVTPKERLADAIKRVID
ncbi:MAG TPA: thioredoxin [Candidatus Obscuribacterales bacterium]